MRTPLVLLVGGALLATGLLPATAVAATPSAEAGSSNRATSSPGPQAVPKGAADTKTGRPAGANPWLSLLPNPSAVDWAAWRQYAKAQGQQRAAAAAAQAQLQAALPAPLLVREDEPVGTRGSNDRPVTAQPIPAFGSAAGKRARALILGTLSPEVVTFVPIAANTEDDGAIPLARATGIGTGRAGIATSGVIGDGPHGEAGTGTGDFDFYALDAAAGDTVNVDTDTPSSILDSMVAIYNAAGDIVAFNDDDGSSLDSMVAFSVPAGGTYYVLVTGFNVLPEDPNDPASGTGAGSEGEYDLRISLADPDLDFYAVSLRKGDVLGASVTGAPATVAIYDPAPLRENVHGSSQDATFILPAASPLPGGGNAVTEHVADQTGWHYILVEEGGGGYEITAEVYRPVLEAPGPQQQTIFLDFNGARVNTGIFGGPGVRDLSPLRAFLGRWGLTNADLNPLIDATVAEVRENLRRDAIERGGNPNFGVRILHSRDNPDTFGRDNVSRVVVGGTIAQSGIPTIGIAQSIDPGNFETEETALVLLDVLSDPSGPASLNTYLGPQSNRVGFIAQALGNVIAHEVGHYTGNFHVDQFNDQANLMDQGGNFPVLYGVGPDNVGGTADDPDVDFGEDDFNPFEGFTGVEDTLTRIAFGLTL